MSVVIVTGGEGYIGRHTCAALARAGFEPVSVDIAGQPKIRADVRTGLAEIVTNLNPAGIVHLAAHSDVAESVRHPEKYAENEEMAAAVAAIGLPVVLASSAAVYGEGGPEPLSENRMPSPINPYGASKVASEALLPDAMRLRYFNVAGGDDPNGHLIPNVLRAIARDEHIDINGDGSAVRDFVHVEDVAEANVIALRALLDGEPGAVLNTCSGVGWSVADVIARCEDRAGPVKRRVMEVRPGDPSVLVGDNAGAAEVLGWRPTRNLDDMISSAWSAVRGAR